MSARRGRGGRSDLLDRLGELLETRAAKATLAVLIVVSVLPYEAIDDTLRPLFLMVFGAELTVRFLLLWRGREERTKVEVAFFLIDLAAFISFLPLHHLDPRLKRVLRVLRVARLLVLLRYMQDLIRDVYSVLTRREQLQQFGLVSGAVAAMAFTAAVVLSQLEVGHDYDASVPDHEEGFWDHMWWAFRQVESPDNLVASAREHPLLLLVSLGLTVMGVFVIAYLIGIGTSVVEQVVRAERLRRVRYRDHTLIVGGVHEGELLVREFVRLFEKNRGLARFDPHEVWGWLVHGGPPPRRHALPRMALLGSSNEPPDYLYERGMRWVVYRQGDGNEPEAIERVAGAQAKRALFLARDAGIDTDAITISSLAAFRAQNPGAHVFVEVRESDNCELVAAVGGAGTFPLDVARFLGLFLCHHVIVPGLERLFRELLAASDHEFYTHVFVDPDEHKALARLGDGSLSWVEMVRRAHRDHGVLLAGVFLWDEPVPRTDEDLVPVDRLHQWPNPTVVHADDAVLRELGCEPGRVPCARLAGVIGVARSYEPVRNYARALMAGDGVLGTSPVDEPARRAAQGLASRIVFDERPLERVLVVGYSPALGSLVRGLARFVPRIDLVVALSARPDAVTGIDTRLSSLGLGFERGERPGAAGRTAELERGGRVTVHTHEEQDLTRFVVGVLGAPVDAAVFLSDPESVDSDARTSLRVLRFARALADGTVPRGERLHLLVELHSLERGEQLRHQVSARRCGFGRDGALDLTLVSTDQIRSYFMVHSAFVPGVTMLYDRLLGARGMELARLPAPGDSDEEVTMGALYEAFAPRRALPFALQRTDGSVVTNPGPGERFAIRDIAGVFVIADSDALPLEFAPRGDVDGCAAASAHSIE